eukprot:755419-Hanusia_phi.AAC.2
MAPPQVQTGKRPRCVVACRGRDGENEQITPRHVLWAEVCGEIERIHVSDITPEEFEKQYVSRGMPVILTGAMEGWPAWQEGSRKWRLEWFRQTYGSVVCPIDIGGMCDPVVFPVSKFQEYENLPPGSAIPYLRTVRAPPVLVIFSLSTLQWYFSDDIPELVKDFTPPDHFHANDMFQNLSPELRPPFRASSILFGEHEGMTALLQWLFFGPKGTESKLHVDIWETDACIQFNHSICGVSMIMVCAGLGMLEGEKLFTLYHPAHRKYIERDQNEWADLLKPPNKTLFPDQSKAVPAQSILKAGEIIYIPRKWPHHALALSESISLTLNFAPLCVRKSILKHVVPYTRNRARCQLCIHGGTIKYGDMCPDEADKARNPMSANQPASSDEDDS